MLHISTICWQIPCVFFQSILKLFHSKGRHKQNETTTYRVGENICKWGNHQGINLQNIPTADTTQYEKNEQPNQKMGHVITAWQATWAMHDRHVISAWSDMRSLHDQWRDQCMTRHVISVCPAKWSVHYSHVISAWSVTW